MIINLKYYYNNHHSVMEACGIYNNYSKMHHAQNMNKVGILNRVVHVHVRLVRCKLQTPTRSSSECCVACVT